MLSFFFDFSFFHDMRRPEELLGLLFPADPASSGLIAGL